MIIGDAMIAGSRWIVFAAIGSTHPIVFAMITVQNRLITTVRQMSTCPGYWIIRRTKLTSARESPQSIPTRISFHITFRISAGSTSPTAIPRMIIVLAWLPEFPPVSINIGINVTKSGITEKAFSYFNKIPPVTILLNIRIISHGIRFLASWNTPVFRYGFSLGSIAAIFSKSSVASCSMTSMTSSTVMMPTRRSSPSTTGKLRRLYSLNVSTTFSWSSVVYALITCGSMISPMSAA